MKLKNPIIYGLIKAGGSILIIIATIIQINQVNLLDLDINKINDEIFFLQNDIFYSHSRLSYYGIQSLQKMLRLLDSNQSILLHAEENYIKDSREKALDICYSIVLDYSICTNEKDKKIRVEEISSEVEDIKTSTRLSIEDKITKLDKIIKENILFSQEILDKTLDFISEKENKKKLLLEEKTDKIKLFIYFQVLGLLLLGVAEFFNLPTKQK
jgi:hypothetical protein